MAGLSIPNDKSLSGRVIAYGLATFTNVDNNIQLVGVGVGVDIGDVISVSGSASNDKSFTIESITDNDNVIVNAAHAGGATSKALIDEVISVKVVLLAKYFIAPVGLGQDWVTVSRPNLTTAINTTNRAIEISIYTSNTKNGNLTFTIDGMSLSRSYVGDNVYSITSAAQLVGIDAQYSISSNRGFYVRERR